MTVYLNAIHNGGANVRASASTSAKVVRTLSGYGELAKATVSKVLPDGNWSEYIFTDGKLGWARGDVHEAVVLKPSVRLNVPYKKQFGDSTNDDRANDCGAACIAMLMAFAGVDKTVDEVTAAVGAPEGIVHFRYFAPAALTFGFKSEVRQSVHLTDILTSLNSGQPMMVLVNYAHLRGHEDYRYGHFVVPIGYELTGDGLNLTVIVHDPYWRQDMRYSAAQFARAIGDMTGTNNGAWQSFFITNYADFITPEPPPPSDDHSPVLMRLATIGREIATHAAAIETLATEQATLLAMAEG